MFVHPLAICESSTVGNGSSVEAFAQILPGAVIGADCSIGNAVFIENDVTIGDRVKVGNGAQILDGVQISDDAIIGPNTTLAYEAVPASTQGSPTPRPVTVEAGALIGANATVLPGVTIGRKAVVGAGSVVTRDVPANARVVGNPARIMGYADALLDTATATDARRPGRTDTATTSALPGGASLVELPVHSDLRGSLSVLQFSDLLPFVPQRCFVVFEVPSQHVRGEHAHRVCWQYLTSAAGSITVHLDDGRSTATVSLDRPGLGLTIPPMVWASQFNATADAVLVVLASHAYDAGDYVRSYDDFLRLVAV